MAYRIRNWSEIFENSESRKLKSLKWVAMPNRMNTQGYTALVDHPHGDAHFGGWCAIVEIASSREPRELRGTLPEADGTIRGISRVLGRISRLPSSMFEELLPRLIQDPDIQWIEQFTSESGESPEASGKSPGISRSSGDELDYIRTEQNSIEEPPKPPAPLALALVPANGVHARRKKTRTAEEIRKALGEERGKWWDAFWAVYPCRDGQTQGMDAFERRVQTRELAIEVFRGAQRYAKQYAADPTMKLKYPQGWINGERWKDENRIQPKSSNGKVSQDELADMIEAFARTR